MNPSKLGSSWDDPGWKRRKGLEEKDGDQKRRKRDGRGRRSWKKRLEEVNGGWGKTKG